MRVHAINILPLCGKMDDQLIEWKEEQVIKVVTGIRRSDKSTFLELYADYLRKTSVADKQIIFINLEALENEYLLDYKGLYQHITLQYNYRKRYRGLSKKTGKCPK